MATLLRFVTDTHRGSISSASAALTLTTGTFVVGDVGKQITVFGAGASGADLVTTISAFTDGTHVTLADSAGTSVSSGVVTYPRLDLNNSSGFVLQRGLNLGTAGLEKVWLSQQPYDGAVLAASRRGIATALIPIRLTKQSSWGAVQTLVAALATELDRATNVLEFRPDGGTKVFLLDTFRADIDSIFHGQEEPNPAMVLQDLEGVTLVIDRQPQMRGAGSYV